MRRGGAEATSLKFEPRKVEFAEMIAHNYQIKRDMIFDMQKGMKISLFKVRKRESSHKQYYKK